MANPSLWFADVCDLARAAANRALQRADSNIHRIEKGAGDWASEVDLEVEREIRSGLSSIAPGTAVHGEEEGLEEINNGASVERFIWHVDPIDGSANYVRGIPHYATVISLTHFREDGSEQVVMGVTYDPCRQECFAALLDQPTTLNGRPVRVSDTQESLSAILAVVTPKPDSAYIDFFASWFARQIRGFGGLRRSGAMAIDLAWVSCGRLDAFVGFNLAPWDIRAGLRQVVNAGGMANMPTQRGSNPSLSPVALEYCLAANSKSLLTKLSGDLHAGSS
jgi:myo-inositol-1(or 4)-monophosphatase